MSSTVSKLPASRNPGSLAGGVTSTKVLHTPTNNKQPTITLTAHKDGLPTPDHSVLHLFKPDPSPYVSSAASNSAAVALADHEPLELKALKEELEVFSQDRKSEFEERTGRAWIPLRAWPREEWEWDLGEGFGALRLEEEDEDGEEV